MSSEAFNALKRQLTSIHTPGKCYFVDDDSHPIYVDGSVELRVDVVTEEWKTMKKVLMGIKG